MCWGGGGGGHKNEFHSIPERWHKQKDGENVRVVGMIFPGVMIIYN